MQSLILIREYDIICHRLYLYLLTHPDILHHYSYEAIFVDDLYAWAL